MEIGRRRDLRLEGRVPWVHVTCRMKCPLPLSTNACGFLTLGSTIANSRDHILTVYTWISTKSGKKGRKFVSTTRFIIIDATNISPAQSCCESNTT